MGSSLLTPRRERHFDEIAASRFAASTLAKMTEHAIYSYLEVETFRGKISPQDFMHL